MWIEFPAIALPLFVIELDTTTPMYEGTVPGGGGLLPVAVVQALPHPDGGVVVGRVIVPSKPLYADGAAPPVRTFRLGHVSAHHVTVVALPAAAAVVFPSVNAPRLGKAKTIAVFESLDAW